MLAERRNACREPSGKPLSPLPANGSLCDHCGRNHSARFRHPMQWNHCVALGRDAKCGDRAERDLRRGEEAMNKVTRFLAAVLLGLFFAGAAAADTLELRDGRVLKGKYLGGTQAVLRFEVSGEGQAFNTNDIVALTFTGHSGTAAAALAPAAASAAANTPAGGDVTIPRQESVRG